MYMYKLSMLTKLMAVHSNYMESVRNKFPVLVAAEQVSGWLGCGGLINLLLLITHLAL